MSTTLATKVLTAQRRLTLTLTTALTMTAISILKIPLLVRSLLTMLLL